MQETNLGQGRGAQPWPMLRLNSRASSRWKQRNRKRLSPHDHCTEVRNFLKGSFIFYAFIARWERSVPTPRHRRLARRRGSVHAQQEDNYFHSAYFFIHLNGVGVHCTAAGEARGETDYA